MKVSGFTIIRNAELMGYPIVESINSVLPLVDEFIIGVGQSEDRTRERIESISSSKLRVFDAYWDPAKTKKGLILSEKTNEALAKCKHNWCFYLQADEVLHEKDYERMLSCMEQYEHDPKVQGILFNYLHFYGAYNFVASSRKWYRSEVRVIKKNLGVQSHSDAKGFRLEGQRLNVVDSGAAIYHYGWVKPPVLMGQKCKLFHHWWFGSKLDSKFENFSFKQIYGLKQFRGTHPQIMLPVVAAQNWVFTSKRRLRDWSFKDLRLMISDGVERLTGKRFFENKPCRTLLAQRMKVSLPITARGTFFPFSLFLSFFMIP